MSKAFTKEGEGDEALEPVAEWPAGVKNYLTPPGHAALKREIESLRDSGGHKPRLQALLQRLEAAEVIDPASQPREVARFGATITVEDEDGQARRYRIVGVDEADPPRGWVSWRSPVALALSGKRVGDTTTLHSPRGDEELTVIAIDYQPA